MSLLREVLDNNKKFVFERNKKGENIEISSHAEKKALIFTCMDTRLINLVEEVMGFSRGEVKF